MRIIIISRRVLRMRMRIISRRVLRMRMRIIVKTVQMYQKVRPGG